MYTRYHMKGSGGIILNTEQRIWNIYLEYFIIQNEVIGIHITANPPVLFIYEIIDNKKIQSITIPCWRLYIILRRPLSIY